jgi:RHS repeat-associated protein
LQKIPIIEEKRAVNFVKISSFSQCLCGFFALKCSQDDVGNLVTTVVNNRNAEYESNLVNQYIQRAIPNVLDIYGQRYAGSEVLVNDQITQRRNRYFYTTQTVENSVFAVPLVIEVKTDGVVDESRPAFVPKNPETFVHDDRGNLIKDGQWNYFWNSLNQLVGVETRSDVGLSPIVKLAIAYDSEGHRWKKTVWTDGVLSYERRFLYENWNLIAELDGENNILKTYVWGTDLSGSMQGAGGVGGLLSMTDHVSGGSYFYLHDGNGNVVGLVDSVSGVVVKEYEYGPFGKVLVESDAGSGVVVDNSFGFSGKYLDEETGLSYYGFRYYSAEMGRWLSRDPAGEDKGGRNLYGFCGNDPIGRVDFLGLKVNIAHIIDSKEKFINGTGSGYMFTKIHGWLDRSHVLAGMRDYHEIKQLMDTAKTNKVGYIYKQGSFLNHMFSMKFKLCFTTNETTMSVLKRFHIAFEKWQGEVLFGASKISSYSYEDLPSVYYGAQMAESFNINVLSEALSKILENVNQEDLFSKEEQIDILNDYYGPTDFLHAGPKVYDFSPLIQYNE